MLDDTPPNYQTGIDAYMDASGEDNWDKSNDEYYLSGILLVPPRKEWLDWVKKHKVEFEGKIHFSDGRYGDGKKLQHKQTICREMIKGLPWGFAFITIFNRKETLSHLTMEIGETPKKYEVTRPLWHVSLVQLFLDFIPYINQCLGRRKDENVLREIVINNPKSGNIGEITREIQENLKRTPKFSSSGHPGIDALDGLLWGIKRFVENGKDDALPWGISDELPKQVLIFGVKEGDNKILRSLNEINQWKSNFI